MSATTNDTLTIDELRERVAEVRTAMATTIDAHGGMAARPLTVQRIDEHGDVYFVVARDADWATDGQAINVTIVADDHTWVSVSGRVELVTGTSLLSDLWDEVIDQFFPDGQDGAVALQVHADRWEYWTAPNKLAELAGMAKAFLLDRRPDVGDAGVVET